MSEFPGGSIRPPVKVLVGTGKATRADRGARVGAFLGRHFRSPILLLVVVAALLIAVRWFSCISENRIDRLDAEQQVDRETANLTQALETHARQLLRDADHDLSQLARESGEACGQGRLNALHAGRVTKYPLALYRENGARCAGMTALEDLTDRMSANPNVDRAGVVQRFSIVNVLGKSQILISQNLRKADGSLAGHAVIEIDADDLIRPFGALDMGPDGVAMVTLLNGDIVARQEGLAVTHGRRASEQLRTHGGPSGAYVGSDGIDDLKRYFKFRRIADYPLIAVVGLSKEDALGSSDARASIRWTQSMTATVFLVLLSAGIATLLRMLARAKRRGEDAERVKGQFLNVMSHELRTPLNGIIGFSELLGKQVTTEPGRKLLQVVRDCAMQLNGQIEDLLTFVDVESGKARARCQDEPVAPLIERIVALYAGQVRDKSLAFETSIEPGAPEKAYFDVSRTLKILDHLLQNAIKFTVTGSVRVTVSGASGDLVISVADTGSGIAEVAQQHLAERFRQADGSVTRSQGGLGLGLALCAGLARLMGMQLEFSSTLGEGSTFSLRIPARAPGSA